MILKYQFVFGFFSTPSLLLLSILLILVVFFIVFLSLNFSAAANLSLYSFSFIKKCYPITIKNWPGHTIKYPIPATGPGMTYTYINSKK